MSTTHAATSAKGTLSGFGTDAVDQAAGAAQNVPGAIGADPAATAVGQTDVQTVANGANDVMSGAVSALGQADALFSWGSYFQALAFLFLIVAALFVVLWFLKRRGGIKLLTGQGNLAIESRMSLGPKKSLLVVRFLNKRVLLGVTDQRITMLTELPLDEDDISHHSSNPAKPADFTAALDRAGKNRSGDSG